MRRPRCLGVLIIAVLFCGCSRDPLLGDFDMALTGGYRLRRESSDVIEVYHVSGMSELRVPAKVVQIAWNARAILAKQQHLKVRGDFQGDAFPVPVPGKFDFWIMDLAHTNRLGPLSEQEFSDNVKKLGYTDLKLKDVSELKQL